MTAGQERIAAVEPAAEAVQPAVVVERRRSVVRRAGELIAAGGWPGLIVIAFVFVALTGPLLAPHDPQALQPEYINLPPFERADFILGTDQFGRDLFSRALIGARLSLVLAVVPVVTGGMVGILLGALAGLGPGPAGVLIMRLVDVKLAFPSIMLALAVVAMMGPSFSNAVLALTIVFIGPIVRVARGLAVDIAARPYIEAARLSGAGTWRIVFDYGLPNMLPTLVVFLASAAGTLLLTGAGLSFLGAGVQPPDIEWGRMVSDGRPVFLINAWPSMLPGVFISVACLGFSRLADRLRDRLDPRWEG